MCIMRVNLRDMAESKFVLMALLEVENTKIERKRSREKIKIEQFFCCF